MTSSLGANSGSRADASSPAVSTKGFDPGRGCDQCGGADAIRAVVAGERLCAKCRNKWLIEETESFGVADRLRPEEREIVLALSDKPSRIGARGRVYIVDACEFSIFDKVWGGDSFRHFLTPFGVQVKDAVLRLGDSDPPNPVCKEGGNS